MPKTLNKQKILDALKLPPSNIDLQIHESVESTNDFPGVVNQDADIKVCLAEEQTKGRGRRGGKWVSPQGQNIYCSVQLNLIKPANELSGLSLAIAVMLVEAFELCGVSGVQVKWPNDLLFDGKKVGGILVELSSRANNTLLNIGMGINVNMDLNEAISQDYTTLAEITGKILDRNKIVAAMLNALLSGLQIFEEKGLQAFVEQWKQFDFYFGKKMTITHGEKTFQGVGAGINPLGELLLKTSDGEMAFSSRDSRICR